MQISGHSFLQHYEIDHAETRRYAARWDDRAEAMALDLNEPLEK